MFSADLSEGCLAGSFRFAAVAVSQPQQYSIATSDTVVPMNIEVPTKRPLSHDDGIVVLESPTPYRPALCGN